MRRRRRCFRGQCLQQFLEQQHLLRVNLLGGPAEQTPQQGLQLVLQALDGPGVLLLLVKKLLTLGKEEFNLLAK